MGGWIVTYIIKVRGGGPSSGYISSGFFGGLTVGRVALLWVNRVVGEKRVVFLYGILIMLYGKKNLALPPGADITRFLRLEIAVWRVPSLVGSAVSVSFVGMLVSHLRLTLFRDTVGDSMIIVGTTLPNPRQSRIQGPSALAHHKYVTHSPHHMRSNFEPLIWDSRRNQVRSDGLRDLDKQVQRCCL